MCKSCYHSTPSSKFAIVSRFKIILIRGPLWSPPSPTTHTTNVTTDLPFSENSWASALTSAFLFLDSPPAAHAPQILLVPGTQGQTAERATWQNELETFSCRKPGADPGRGGD